MQLPLTITALAAAVLLFSPKSNDEPVLVQAESAIATSAGVALPESGGAVRAGAGQGWLEYVVEVPVTGRYVTELHARALEDAPVTLWVEDHVGNPDGRTYDITGPMLLSSTGGESIKRSGSPMGAGKHRVRVHFSGGAVEFDALCFTLLEAHVYTPTTLVQRTEGETWALVWSDEFDADGLPDGSKWAYDIGDWGWGNREPQEYTREDARNARCEGGKLVIEARRDDAGHWTSARLTTRGRASFLYGRMEIRAKVPVGDGAWAAGWMLGDAYRDELSWPYCGEIDVMEAVGREIDDEPGDGLNHASCHTRAYYFKQGNHISNQRAVPGMGKDFHVYSMEWTPTEVRMYVDGDHYYTYAENENELEWPFDQPQNLILNLAMGGGMGGAIDPELTSQRLVVDYVRFYGQR